MYVTTCKTSVYTYLDRDLSSMKYMNWGPKLHVLRKSKQVNFEAITTRLFQTILKVLLLVLYINQHKQWKPYRDTIFLIFFKEKTYDCCFKSQHTGIPPCLTSYNNLSKQKIISNIIKEIGVVWFHFSSLWYIVAATLCLASFVMICPKMVQQPWISICLTILLLHPFCSLVCNCLLKTIYVAM